MPVRGNRDEPVVASAGHLAAVQPEGRRFLQILGAMSKAPDTVDQLFEHVIAVHGLHSSPAHVNHHMLKVKIANHDVSWRMAPIVTSANMAVSITQHTKKRLRLGRLPEVCQDCGVLEKGINHGVVPIDNGVAIGVNSLELPLIAQDGENPSFTGEQGLHAIVEETVLQRNQSLHEAQNVLYECVASPVNN